MKKPQRVGPGGQLPPPPPPPPPGRMAVSRKPAKKK